MLLRKLREIFHSTILFKQELSYRLTSKSLVPAYAHRSRQRNRHVANSTLESLEQRLLLTNGLSLQPIDDVDVLSGSPLHVVLDGFSESNEDITFTVTSDNADISAEVLTGNRSLRLSFDDGDMVFELFEQRASRVTQRVVELTESGFYDGLTFHRIIDGFVIQGGDPLGNGRGGSDLPDFDDQYHPELQHNRTGILSFANAGDDTNNSQFFITENPQRRLDFDHPIFGQLTEGEDLREAISNVATDNLDAPIEPVVINTAEIFTDTENGLVMLNAAEGYTGSAEITVTARDESGNEVSHSFVVSVSPDTVDSKPYLEEFVDEYFIDFGESIEFDLMATDVENSEIEYLLGQSTRFADVVVDPTSGHVTVTPIDGFYGQFSFLLAARIPNSGGSALDSQVVTVNVDPGRELVIDSVSIDAINAGETGQIRFSISNTGDIDAGEFLVRHYLSINDEINLQDTLLLETTVDGLAANSTEEFVVDVTLPSPDDASAYSGNGNYRIITTVDPDNRVPEEFDTNQNVERLLITNADVTPNFDIDGDTQFDALSDGLTILRYLASFSGPRLLDSFSESTGIRTTEELIVPLLDDLRSTGFDVDGDGTALPLTDGLLIVRYIAGFRGTTLIDSAVSPTATRTSSDEIQTFLFGFFSRFGVGGGSGSASAGAQAFPARTENPDDLFANFGSLLDGQS